MTTWIPRRRAVSSPRQAADPQVCTARASHSRFVQRVRRRYAGELPLLPPGVPKRAAIDALIDRLLQDGRALPRRCAWRASSCIERLAVLDVERGATLDDVTRAMTDAGRGDARTARWPQRLRDARHALRRAAQRGRQAHRLLGRRHGQARRARAQRVVRHRPDLRLRGRRPAPTAPQSISAHEYFAHVARRLYALIGDATDDGFVFRVDLALRPERQLGAAGGQPGDAGGVLPGAGPRMGALRLAEEPRRRAARARRRTAARSRCARWSRRSSTAAISTTACSKGCASCTRKIRDEAQRRAAGRPERANDVKLSRGGIREIEFIVQLLLVVRGGQFPEIRTRSTLNGLQRLAAGGLMKPDTRRSAWPRPTRSCAASSTASSTSTTSRPTCCRPPDGDLDWIARSLGLDVRDADACELLDRLGETREFVADRVRRAAARRPRAGRRRDGRAAAARRCGQRPLPVDSEAFLEQLPPELAARVRPLAPSSRACSRCATKASCAWRRLVQRAARRASADGALHARRPRCASSTGSSRCCGARATSRCWSSGPRCSSGCCACSAWRAGRCAT